LLLPGEQAYAHRHSANAFRLVLEAPDAGAYTTVEGTRLPMCFGDLLCTPNWTWHDHHNESGHDVIWYDGLDVLMAYWIGGVFYQEMEPVTGAAYQSVAREEAAVSGNFGPGLIHRQAMFPEHIPASNNALTYYPYAKARELLGELSKQKAGTPQDGTVLEYVNPVTSGPTFPTMATSVRLIDANTNLQPVQRTENVIFITLEGSATFHLPNGQTIVTNTFDVTAIPSWVPYSIANTGNQPAVLFSQSDKPVFQALGFYRENPGGS
jgi:gentisate 1,2-dioxygenase